MRTTENERRDWAVIAFILLFGLFWILLAGSCALRFTPRWELDTNVQSELDPNSDFLTNKPVGFIEPVDPAILTNPAWMNAFLTPGASFPAVTQHSPATNISVITSATWVTTQTIIPTTTVFGTGTVPVLVSPTNTLVYFPPVPTFTATSGPVSPSTLTRTSTSTLTSTATATSTSTDTPTSTPTHTPTSTTTNTPTDTPTETPTATTLPGCGTTITITSTSGSYAKPGGSTCFEYTDTFANGGIFQITSTGVNGMVDGDFCGGVMLSNGSTVIYGVEQFGGVMIFRITGTAGTLDISISDWTTYPICP